MNRKSKILFVALILISVIGITAVVAEELFLNPEGQILRELLRRGTSGGQTQDKIKGLDALEEEEARIRVWQNLSGAEKKQVIEEKKRGHQEYMRKTVPQELSELQPEQSPFVGIIEGDEVPAPFRSNEFKVLNFWGGEIDGKRIGVYAGYRPKNPHQGVVVVFSDPNQARGRFYSTPKASGPVRITSERGGVLVLESVGGEFEVHNPKTEGIYTPENVRVSGGTPYLFDLRTHVFQ